MRYAVVSLTALACLAAMPAAAREQAGVAAGVTGPVQLASAENAVGTNVTSGQKIFLGDKITSGPNGRMQVLLLDQTVLTLGPNSVIAIDKFVYDPSTAGGQLQVNMTKGALRFVTGRIAQNRPQDMQIKTPTATIGIRGTLGGVQTLTPQQADQALGDQAQGTGEGDKTVAFLMGPDLNDDSGSRPGAFDVTGGDGDTKEVRRPGDGVVSGPGGTTDPFTLPDSFTTGFFQNTGGAVLPGESQGGGGDAQGGGDNAGNQGGGGDGDSGGRGGGTQVAFAGGGDNAVGGSGAGISGGLSGAGINQLFGQSSGQNDPNFQKIVEQLQQTQRQIGEFTTFDELRSIQTGFADYTQYSVPMFGTATGTYDFYATVDFGNREFTYVEFTNIMIPTFGIHNGYIDAGNYSSFATSTGPAMLSGSFSGSLEMYDGCANCVTNYNVAFKNSGSNIAASVDHSLTVNNPDLNKSAFGSGNAIGSFYGGGEGCEGPCIDAN